MPRPKKYEKRINIFLSQEQLEEVQAEADKMGVSVSAYLRICVVKALRERQVMPKYDCILDGNNTMLLTNTDNEEM